MSNMARLLPTLFFFAVTLWPSATEAQEALQEGVVEFAVEYEDAGPMAAFFPKQEFFYFRQGQSRTEYGSNTTLRGVEPGREIRLVELPGKKVAFSLPVRDAEADGDLRAELSQETKKIAGLVAKVAYLVDVRDPSNRLPVLLSTKVPSEGRSLHPDLEGFALDFYRPMQEGLGHWRAVRVEAETLEDQLFEVPEGYERHEVESVDDLGSKIKELLGGDVEVIRQ